MSINVATTPPGTFGKLAVGWIAARDSHDPDEIRRQDAGDMGFASPFIQQTGVSPTGRLKGKDALRGYFEKALIKDPALRFALYYALSGAGPLVLFYRSANGPPAAVYREQNALGEVVCVRAHNGGAGNAQLPAP